MAHAVLVFIEQRDGNIKKSSFEALGAGKTVAQGLGGTTAAVIVGHGIAEAAAGLGARGADAVYAADAEVLAAYSPEGYAAAVHAAAAKAGAKVLVFAATALGKDLAPRIAARRDAVFFADCTEAAVDGGRLVVRRPQYAGKTTWKLAADPSNAVVTVRPNVFPAPEASGSPAQVEAVDAGPVTVRARVTGVETKEQDVIDVAEADVVVSGGRGLKGPENFPLLFDLAKVLGAGVGASRAVVDAGWIAHDHQVGQTGKTVSPKLYIAAGISGAIQHLAGMRTSGCIVAINKDAEAPIFQAADYGLVGDALEILPKLTAAVKALRS